MKQYNVQDFYFLQAKKLGYVARSAFKLEEIQQKFWILTPSTHSVIDIGCAPGSRMQYTSQTLTKLKVKDFTIIGCDLKPSTIQLPHVYTYVQDAQDLDAVQALMTQHDISSFDVILSDLAPNTMGIKDVDAYRATGIIRKIFPLYRAFLKPEWRFAIKFFMWPGFDEFVKELRTVYGHKSIKIFKPKSCRFDSKEIYVIKV